MIEPEASGIRPMKRVPVELVILILAQDGIEVNARQLRNWKHRGRISRGEGYDLQEVVDYLGARGVLRHAA